MVKKAAKTTDKVLGKWNFKKYAKRLKILD